MRVRLARRWTKKLAHMPESGMGYQRVQVHLKAGRTVDDLVVYNARFLEIPDEVPPFEPEDIDEITLASDG